MNASAPSPRRGRRGQRAVAELMTVAAALAHDRYAGAALEFLAAAKRSAHAGDGALECATCSRPWALGRKPVALLVIEPLTRGPMPPLVAGVCGACARRDDARAQALTALHKNLLLDPCQTVVLAAGGAA